MEDSLNNVSEPMEYDIRILRAVRKIIRAVDIHSRQLHRDFNITTPQLICLYSLKEHSSMTLSELAKDVSLGMSTTNGIIDRLVKRNLVSRQQSFNDRRKVELKITNAGVELLDSAPELLQQQFMDAFNNLTELEQATIALSLEQVVNLMGAGNLDSSPNLLPGAKVKIKENEPEG